MVPFQFWVVYHELRASGQFETMTRSVDEDEHSIEMHLPYVAKVMERWARVEEGSVALSCEGLACMLSCD